MSWIKKSLALWMASWTSMKLNNTLVKLDQRRKDSLKQLHKLNRDMNSLRESLETKTQEIQDELNQARTIHKQYAEQLETVRGEKRVLDSLVHGLVASNKLYEERWQAQTAIEVMRQVAHSGNRGE